MRLHLIFLFYCLNSEFCPERHCRSCLDMDTTSPKCIKCQFSITKDNECFPVSDNNTI